VLVAVLSDIHANLPALEAVLADADRRGCSAFVCLGDVVGYGASPKRCLDLVRERCSAIVQGNHDLAVASGDFDGLPSDGEAAARLHNRQLDARDLEWLGGLPLTATFAGATLVHATPQNPERWHRVGSFLLAKAQFDHFDTDICFAGHTHQPAVMGAKLGQFRVQPGGRFFVNVGSIGQPRDDDPRAAYGVFDAEAFGYELVRVPYNVEQAVRDIDAAGLPPRLGRRLQQGR
jgi:diadenosine tetraphosphatase ApaH/serine/threonine PP2A family protein phosphatase